MTRRMSVSTIEIFIEIPSHSSARDEDGYQIVSSRIIFYRTQIEFFIIVIFAFLLVVDAHFPPYWGDEGGGRQLQGGYATAFFGSIDSGSFLEMRLAGRASENEAALACHDCINAMFILVRRHDRLPLLQMWCGGGESTEKGFSYRRIKIIRK
jgi:hypothetical protein